MVDVVFQTSKVCKVKNFKSCDEVTSSVLNYVEKKIAELNEKISADEFINKCKELDSYLIKNKSDCNQCYGRNYQSDDIDELVKIYLETVTKFGGCPQPLTPEGEERIKLISEIEEFCEKKKGHIEKIKSLRVTCNAQKECNNSETYKTECSTYLKLLDEKKKHFLDNKKGQITHIYEKHSPQIKSLLACDVRNPETFANKENICHEDKSEESKLYPIFLDGYAVDDITGGDISNSINSETPRYKLYYEIPDATVTGAPIPQTFRKTLPPQKQLPYQENLTLEENPPLGFFHNEHELFPSLPEFRSSPKANQIFVQMIEPALPPPNSVSGYKFYLLIFIIIAGVLTSFALLMKNTPIGLYLSRNKRKKRIKAHEKINRVLLGLQSPEDSHVNFTYGGFSS